MPLGHFFDERPFTNASRSEERITGIGTREALVDDPGKWLDFCPPQVLLEIGRLVHRRRFRQGNDQNPGELLIAQPWQQVSNVFGHITGFPGDFAMVSLGSI